ncbi:hypothetical protein FOMG_14360 [Fusarium oxysporum f. sp. melonis 26406]|uniref:Uncharacterized protein n=1 Tax=Fusarium oxysporum f. sp. melonis 26406 TaxID=1089452 RepID=X0A7K1_FUSOX|nr:hypothetical protein FOMG_14360 [Fusarium oxysporum f. sp. melonis 26406]
MHFSVDHLEVAGWDTIRVGPSDHRSSASDFFCND